jgi:N-methylhydantoinase B
MDEMPGGGGARSYADGVDTAGISYIPPSSAPNVETYELMFPVLYLFRRQGIDSGGAGKFRGGVGGEYSITLYNSPAGKATMTLYGTGFEPATATPLFGGYPANNNRWIIVRETDILKRIKRGDFPEFVEHLKGNLENLPTKGVTEITDGDVFYCHWMGGGGYGDPIEREPQSVCKDVINKIVSLKYAKDIYGVIINPDTLEVDIDKTREIRRTIRMNRIQKEVDWEESYHNRERGKPLNESLKIDKISEKEMILCKRCEYIFSPLIENYKKYAIVRENPLIKGGPKLSPTERFILREFYCPECGTRLEVEMILKELPFIWDIQIIS